MTTSLNHCSLNFIASLEHAYTDLQSIHDLLKRQDGDVLELVHRIHGVEDRVSRLVASLDGTLADLRAVRKSKMAMLSSIVQENVSIAERLGKYPVADSKYPVGPA